MRSEPGSGVLVLACGALAREVLDLKSAQGLHTMTVECLPAALHNQPARIPDALRSRLAEACDQYETVLVGYADCGTAGEIDKICEEYDVERLPGAHCYQFFAGTERFDAMHDEDPTVFYLTDFLVRHFDRIVMRGLGLIEHPELREAYFGNYTTLRYLAQTSDRELDRAALGCATKLGLRYERIQTGYGDLTGALVGLAGHEPSMS